VFTIYIKHSKVAPVPKHQVMKTCMWLTTKLLVL